MWRWNNGRNSRRFKFANKKSKLFLNDEKKMKKNLELCIPKGKNGGHII